MNLGWGEVARKRAKARREQKVLLILRAIDASARRPRGEALKQPDVEADLGLATAAEISAVTGFSQAWIDSELLGLWRAGVVRRWLPWMVGHAGRGWLNSLWRCAACGCDALHPCDGAGERCTPAARGYCSRCMP